MSARRHPVPPPGCARWCVLAARSALPFLGPACEPALDEAIARLREAQCAYNEVQDYVAVLHRQERVRGELQAAEVIRLKFRKPFQVYLKWVGEARAGRELLYAEGWNENRLMAHEGGVLGFITLSLDPDGALALRHSRHPVTDTGIGRMLEVVSESMHRAVAAGELEIVDVAPTPSTGGVRGGSRGACRGPRQGLLRRARGHGLDLESKLPIQIAIYDAEGRLTEKYGYEHLQLNVGLTELDFEPTNPDYRF